MAYKRILEILDKKYEGKEVEIKGWLYNSRSSGGIRFLQIRDGSGVIQATVKKDDVDEKTFKTAGEMTQESSLIAKGIVKEDKRAPTGFELKIKSLRVVFPADEYPLGKKEHGPDFLFSHRHLWLRSPKQSTLLLLREEILKAVREYFEMQGYHEVHPPIVCGVKCEGGSDVFELKFFDRKAYLPQSSQMYLEAMIFSLGKVWCIAPSFRAEKSHTTKHLTEYWHIEGEEAWQDFEELIKFLEGLISYVAIQLAKKRPEELKAFGRDPKDLLKLATPFPRIKYDDAVKLIQKDGIKMKYGDDIGTVEEKQLSTHFDKPFFITLFPRTLKPFYMKSAPDEKYVLGADLIAPEGYGELIGGSQREDDEKVLLKRLKGTGEKIANYQWYLDLRKYGSVPHSGFGLGFERLVRWLLKLDSIREAVPFSRTPDRIYP